MENKYYICRDHYLFGGVWGNHSHVFQRSYVFSLARHNQFGMMEKATDFCTDIMQAKRFSEIEAEIVMKVERERDEKMRPPVRNNWYAVSCHELRGKLLTKNFGI